MHHLAARMKAQKEDTARRIEKFFDENPQATHDQCAAALGISRITVWRSGVARRRDVPHK